MLVHSNQKKEAIYSFYLSNSWEDYPIFAKMRLIAESETVKSIELEPYAKDYL